MLQQDYILNEAKKFAALLARLMGLKAEGDLAEFQQAVDEAMQQEYDTNVETLLSLPGADFEAMLLSCDYSAEKLNALAQILYVYAHPFSNEPENVLMLKKVLSIFDTLEQKHNYYAFENIEKRKNIYNYYKHNE